MMIHNLNRINSEEEKEYLDDVFRQRAPAAEKERRTVRGKWSQSCAPNPHPVVGRAGTCTR